MRQFKLIHLYWWTLAKDPHRTDVPCRNNDCPEKSRWYVLTCQCVFQFSLLTSNIPTSLPSSSSIIFFFFLFWFTLISYWLHIYLSIWTYLHNFEHWQMFWIDDILSWKILSNSTLHERNRNAHVILITFMSRLSLDKYMWSLDVYNSHLGVAWYLLRGSNGL